MPDNTLRLLSTKIASFFDEFEKADPPLSAGTIKSRLMEWKLDAQSLENGQSLAEAHREISALQTLKESLQEENKNLDTKAKDCEALSDQAIESARLIQNKQKEQEAQCAAKQSEIETLSIEAGTLRQEKEGLRQELIRVDSEGERYRRQVENRLVELNDEKRANREEIDRLKSEVNRLQGEIERLGKFEEEFIITNMPGNEAANPAPKKPIELPAEAETVLWHLFNENAEMYVRPLAEKLKIEPGRIQHYLEEMADAGLVKEGADPNDPDAFSAWFATREGRAYIVKNEIIPF
jgi:hypothetical protein